MVANVHGTGQRRRLARSRGIRCLLNGRDVTPRAFYADTRRGIVRLYKVDISGKKYVDRDLDIVATEELRGKVRLVRSEAA